MAGQCELGVTGLATMGANLARNAARRGFAVAVHNRTGSRTRELVDRYGELTQHAVFYLDPHICIRCRYRSTELLWQCPHCHEWNTFLEERISPKDIEAVLTPGP